MFGRKCSLCGGKLNGSNICVECGLDNTKSDKNYRMNQNTADSVKMTHVHGTGQTHSWEKKTVQKQPKQRSKVTEKAAPVWGGQVKSPYKTSQTSQSRKKGKNVGKKVVWIVLIIVVLWMVLPILFVVCRDVVPDLLPGSSESEYEYEYEYDSYAFSIKDFQEGGELYSATLTTGEYVVGVHIPEGRYTLKAVADEYSSVDIDDDANSVWMYLSLDGAENKEKGDVRLFLGARFSVDSDSGIIFESENAQTGMMAYQENPLTESVILDQESATAGVEFEPGVYDIVMTEGYGGIDIGILGEDGNYLEGIYGWLDAEDESRSVYKNVVFPEGAHITCDDEDAQVTLVPSEKIVNTDYMAYYTGALVEQEPFASLIQGIEEASGE